MIRLWRVSVVETYSELEHAENACMDGRNMALLLANLQSGFDTFTKVWIGLEMQYPFHNSELQKSFQEALCYPKN